VRTNRCAIVGAPRDAEELAFSALELGQRAGQPDADVWFIGHLYTVRLLAGTLAEGEPNLAALLETSDSSTVVGHEFTPSRSIPLLLRAAMSAILCEVGRTEDARAPRPRVQRDRRPARRLLDVRRPGLVNDRLRAPT